MTTTTSLFLSTLSLFSWPALGFDLGTSNDNWGLTTDTLDQYTSHACRMAYETPIDCSDTLQALVSSPDPDYLPSASDLDYTCTDTCRASIESYVRNVEEVCSEPWDWALISTAAVCTDCRLVQTPVENVGKIFQYKLESACALDSNSDYCYLRSSHEGADFPCSDTCAIEYYKSAHRHRPISNLKFSNLWLVEESNYWEQDFENGYKRALECEKSA